MAAFPRNLIPERRRLGAEAALKIEIDKEILIEHWAQHTGGELLTSIAAYEYAPERKLVSNWDLIALWDVAEFEAWLDVANPTAYAGYKTWSLFGKRLITHMNDDGPFPVFVKYTKSMMLGPPAAIEVPQGPPKRRKLIRITDGQTVPETS